MIPLKVHHGQGCQSIPRESGDDPGGWDEELLPGGVFPARAGMILRSVADSSDARGIPRESGDDPFLRALHEPGPEYSPRERG